MVFFRSTRSAAAAFLLAFASWCPQVSSKSNQHIGEHPDRVYIIPGYPHSLPSPWFSGYLDYEIESTKIHTHYVYIEAEETDDPDSTPLVYWSNGGPGASSIFGLMTELGPLLFSDLSLQTESYKETGIPTPIYNPSSWTKLGSILVFDAPAPVGFSYCNDEYAGKGHSCLDWTDELSSLNTYLAMQAFYVKFPALLSRPLYLTGESYAGIYIPTLARRLLQNEPSSGVRMNLKGFAVGDGCLGTDTPVCGELGNNSWLDQYFSILFLAGHGQLPYSVFQKVVSVCGGPAPSEVRRSSSVTKDCERILQEVKDEVGGFYEYSLYDDCTYKNGILATTLGVTHLEGAVNDYPCGGGFVLDHYMTLTTVKEAFHIPIEAQFFSVDNAADFSYTPTEPNLRGFYKDVASGKYGNVRALVYNGDADPAITSFAAQNWTGSLGLTEVESWRPWTIDGCRRMGGYVQRYEGSFDFLTIRGAGHMVPTYKPEASFAFLKAWLEGADYPVFNRDCVAPSWMTATGQAAKSPL
jgi:serine carboxypeptidase-like clade I